jgi:hypothetical protein
VTAMQKYKMDIYTVTTGVQMTLSWDTGEEYQLGKKFLTDMGAACSQSGKANTGKPEFFYLQNEQQLESLFAFRQKLKKP